ncbi:MAG: hypothetical protein MRJ96_15145 [Nitrospirales bacterium]|nr:hypothetical protein [Nitrospira sp.]MDR4502778.1 hypothetical protein [Nitrospirales bacterium]
MKQVLPRIWEWQWFSDEKQLDFNGHLLEVGEHRILVDPPLLSSTDIARIRQGDPVDYIILTNRDHEREAQTYKTEFGCQLFVPDKDAPDMSVEADKTFKDGELLPGGIWVIQLTGQKSAGESALFVQQGKGILLVGDALIGKPAGSLSLLPPEKYPDPAKAREGLGRLLKYQFDALLVGDGTSILTNAKAVVEEVVETP